MIRLSVKNNFNLMVVARLLARPLRWVTLSIPTEMVALGKRYVVPQQRSKISI
jgi:hypothetical protein